MARFTASLQRGLAFLRNRQPEDSPVTEPLAVFFSFRWMVEGLIPRAWAALIMLPVVRHACLISSSSNRAVAALSDRGPQARGRGTVREGSGYPGPPEPPKTGN